MSFVRHPTKKGKGDNNRQRGPPPSRRTSSDTGDMKRKSTDTDGKQTGTRPPEATHKPHCFKFRQGKCDKEKTCLFWNPRERTLSKRGISNRGKKCVFLYFKEVKSRRRRRKEGEETIYVIATTPVMRRRRRHAVSSSRKDRKN